MEDHRGVNVLDLRQHVDQAGDIVPVDGAKVFEPEALEYLAGPDRAFDTVPEVLPGLFDGVSHRAGQLLDHLFAELFELIVGAADADALEVLAESALRLADAHSVVVEDDEQLPLERARAVEALEGQSVDDRGIADDGDDVVAALEVSVAAGHADCRGDGRAGVPDGKKIVWGFLGRREPAHGPFLAEPVELARPAGQELVRIGLVSDVKEQAVGAGGVGAEVVNIMQGEGQLDDAEIGSQVPAVPADGVEDPGAHLGGQVGQLTGRQLPHVAGRVNGIEQVHSQRHCVQTS